MRICAVPDCEQPVRDRDWCAMHGVRVRRYGDPLHVERKLTKGSPFVRFWSHVNVGAPEECWEWTASTFRERGGYGKFQAGQGIGKSKVVYTHRYVYELTRGPIPKHLQVCHRCDNPPCCNPSHLFIGTASDNLSDAARKGRIRGPYGLMGNPQPCGTVAGYSTHRRRGEPICDACRQANREYHRNRRALT